MAAMPGLRSSLDETSEALELLLLLLLRRSVVLRPRILRGSDDRAQWEGGRTRRSLVAADGPE